MNDDPAVAAARIEAEHRRGQVMALAHQLQARLSPRTLAQDAWQGAKEKSADLAENAVDAVRARPVAATGVVAAIALFLAREPLMQFAGRMVDGAGDKRKTRRTRKAAAKQETSEKAS